MWLVDQALDSFQNVPVVLFWLGFEVAFYGTIFEIFIKDWLTHLLFCYSDQKNIYDLLKF